MSLAKLLSSFGMCDGLGNTSSIRVINMLVVLAVIVPRVTIAIQTRTPPTWSQEDLMMLGVVLGAKLVQNQQETKIPTAGPTATPNEK